MDHGILVGVFGRLPFSQPSQGHAHVVPGLVEFGVDGRGDFKISLHPLPGRREALFLGLTDKVVALIIVEVGHEISIFQDTEGGKLCSLSAREINHKRRARVGKKHRNVAGPDSEVSFLSSLQLVLYFDIASRSAVSASRAHDHGCKRETIPSANLDCFFRGARFGPGILEGQVLLPEEKGDKGSTALAPVLELRKKLIQIGLQRRGNLMRNDDLFSRELRYVLSDFVS